jgi:hypothetical protein
MLSLLHAPGTGPLDFHRNSLLNLSEAMRRTRRLCATVIDTMGRELMVRGQWQVNDQVNVERFCGVASSTRSVHPVSTTLWCCTTAKGSLFQLIMKKPAHITSLTLPVLPCPPPSQGYPWVLGRNEVAAGQVITITTRPDAVASESVLPIMWVAHIQGQGMGDE